MPDKCPECPVPSADMDGFIVSGPGGAPRSEGSGVSSPEGPFAREAPQTGHVIIMGTLGADGNPGSLPDAPQVGWAYVAGDDGTYGGVQATEGDVVYCMSLNPVKWGVLQADSDDSGRDLVSVSASFGCDPSPALSLTSAKASGASSVQTVDMSCLSGMYGALDSVSASFSCGGRTWYLSSYEVAGYVEEDDDYVEHAVAPALLDGDLSVDLTPRWIGGSASHYVLSRIFLLSNVPVYGGVCYHLARGYDISNIFISEGYEDTAPEDIVLFSLHSIIENYSMPAAGEEIELPVSLDTYNGTGILPVTGIGASASAYSCADRDRMVMHEMLDQLSVSPLKLYATGPESGYVGRLRVEKNSAFDWSQYESGAKLTLTSTSASGEETVQEVDMSCLGSGVIQTLSGDFDCETHEISPAVDEPAVLYATKMVFLDQTGFEMLEGGNAPYGHYSSAYSGSHQSASFSTSVPSSAPYAIALSTGTNEYASGYNLKRDITIMDWPYGGAVAVSDLLAAGETGVKLVFRGGDSTPYGDGTLDVYASFSANQDGSYTVSYSARKDAVTEDILTAKIDGKDGSGAAVSSVDVSPLLNYIGGRIEEVPAGNLEMLPLVDPENPGVEPPYYFCLWNGFGFTSSGGSVSPDAATFSDGVLTVSFSASSPEPESFVPLFYYGDFLSNPSIVYAKLDSSTGNSAAFTLETAFAGPLVLDELDISSNSPAPTGNTVSLVTERIEGPAPTYRFTLYSGSGEMKKVLRLYPSCDGDIDLSGLDVSVEQVLSSGTKIATVTVDGQATDLFCTSGGGSAGELSFECGAAASPVAVSSDISAGMFAYPSSLTPPFPDSYAYPLSTDGNTFTIKGSEFTTYASRAGSLGVFHLIVKDGDEGYYFHTLADTMAYFFSGAHGIGVGTVRQFIGSSRGFLLESRTELTSEDPGGPDIVCVFRFVETGGARLALGDQIANLSCIAENAGPADYSLVYSTTVSSGSAAPYVIDLSTVANDVDGFRDVLVYLSFNNYASFSVKSDRFSTVELDFSNITGNRVGFVRFWNDGGLNKLSSGVIAAPSYYSSYNVPMSEYIRTLGTGPGTPAANCTGIITLIPPSSASTFSSSVSVSVYARYPHSAV